jgi:hypothetical protein
VTQKKGGVLPPGVEALVNNFEPLSEEGALVVSISVSGARVTFGSRAVGLLAGLGALVGPEETTTKTDRKLAFDLIAQVKADQRIQRKLEKRWFPAADQLIARLDTPSGDDEFDQEWAQMEFRALSNLALVMNKYEETWEELRTLEEAFRKRGFKARDTDPEEEPLPPLDLSDCFMRDPDEIEAFMAELRKHSSK